MLMCLHQCACGEIGACKSSPKSACNCDGSSKSSELLIDEGLIIDKDHLPVTKVVSGGVYGSGRASFYVGVLKCGPKQFGELFMYAL